MYLALKKNYKDNKERKTNPSQPKQLTLPFGKTNDKLLMKKRQ